MARCEPQHRASKRLVPRGGGRQASVVVNPSLSETIRRAREARKWTRNKLAEETGLAASTIEKIELSRTSRIRPETLALLNAHLGLVLAPPNTL